MDTSAAECSTAAQDTLLPLERATTIATLCKALADPTRVRLLALIRAVPGGTVCACHLPDTLGIAQSTLSHHLSKLVDAGLLTREQRGRWAHYTAVEASLDELGSFFEG